MALGALPPAVEPSHISGSCRRHNSNADSDHVNPEGEADLLGLGTGLCHCAGGGPPPSEIESLGLS